MKLHIDIVHSHPEALNNPELSIMYLRNALAQKINYSIVVVEFWTGSQIGYFILNWDYKSAELIGTGFNEKVGSYEAAYKTAKKLLDIYGIIPIKHSETIDLDKYLIMIGKATDSRCIDSAYHNAAGVILRGIANDISKNISSSFYTVPINEPVKCSGLKY